MVYLNIGTTGVRNEEFIICEPHHKQCLGTVMQIFGFYPPIKEQVDELTPEQIRDSFNQFSFFKDMSYSARNNYLQSHSVDSDLYLQDIPNLMVKFHQIGGEFMLSSLSSETINLLLNGQLWPIQQVYNLFPRKPGSKAYRHTLVFRPHAWMLQVYVPVINTFTGLTLNLSNSEVRKTTISSTPIFAIVSPQKTDTVLKSPPLLIYDSQPGSLLTEKRLFNIWTQLGINKDSIKLVQNILSWATPAVYKSLIQKLIRTHCKYVIHQNTTYTSHQVMAAALTSLLLHPGSFVPNIQRFVTGAESALKRLAISISEDSWTDSTTITSLLAGAWLAQNLPKEKLLFSDSLLLSWLTVSLTAIDYPSYFLYDIHADVVLKTMNNLSLSYYLIRELGSFDLDLKMMASIAKNNGYSRELIDPVDSRIMPLIHCIDQHSFTDIAHYFPYESLTSYPQLFMDIWNKVVGINPRDGGVAADFFLQADPTIRQAQQLIWWSRSVNKQPYPVIGNRKILHSLDPSILASLVGPVEIKHGSITSLVMIKPDDIYTYIAIKKPSRDTKKNQLTEDEIVIFVNKFVKLLEAGINITHLPVSLSTFKDKKVFLKNGEYFIDMLPWETARIINLQVDVHPKTNLKIENSLLYTGTGIQDQAFNRLEAHLAVLDKQVIQRAEIYLNTGSIELYHIGRDGYGVGYTVNITDTAVNHLLSTISILFPAVLEKSGTKYLVKSVIMDQIISMIQSHKFYQYSPWPLPLPDSRTLWRHQLDAIDSLLDANHRVSILYLTVGMGKTAIIANYIRRLIINDTMPAYCVYTLPPSALETVSNEFSLLGYDVNHLDMRKDGVSKTLLPSVINLVYHDHLRLMNMEAVKNISNQLFFVVDEFHKTLNTTQRTSCALELAHLSLRTVAMTGTLITNRDIVPIISWLNMTTSFETTIHNYWVAIAGIIARQVSTGVKVNKEVIEAPMNAKERRDYLSVVPANLGGTAHKIDFVKAVEYSYKPITRLMVKMILELGPGIFVVAKNRQHQEEIRNKLVHRFSVFLISKDDRINLTPDSKNIPDIVITTPTHAEGYNATAYRIMISCVIMNNITIQEQLEGRINRLSQRAKSVDIYVIHAGIMSYIYRHQETARRLSEALKAFAKEVGIDQQDLKLIK